MCSQEVSLSWQGHHGTLINVFEKLLENGSLVDCTIVAEGQRLKAHKEVLSAFSPYFELIFKEENEVNPTVILSGITFQELKAFIDFMYYGNVKISEDKVEDLIDAAESLQIKGLGGGCKNEEEGEIHERSNLQTRQICSSGSACKCKGKEETKDSASEKSADIDVKISSENIDSFIENQNSEEPLVCQVGQTSIMRRTPNVKLEKPSARSDQHGVKSLRGPPTLPPVEAECQILHPESVVKVELGVDDNDFIVEPKKEVISSKRSRYSHESGGEDAILGLSADISMSSDSSTFEHFLPNRTDVPSSSKAGLTPVTKSMSSGSSSLTSCSKKNSSTVDGQPEDGHDIPLHPEMLVKTEPKVTDEMNLNTEACFSEVGKSEHQDGLEKRRGPLGREMGPATYEENSSLYPRASFPGTNDQWIHQQHPTTGSLEISGGGSLCPGVVWAPGMPGCSGDLRRRGPRARPPRKYSCPQCQKVFNQSCNLKVHMRTHTGEKPYKCTECGFAATHISNLKQHLRTHSGERPYKCLVCDYAATDISSFKRHQRMHNGLKPYKCTECNYSATDIGSYKRHLRIHSGERPYKCNECEYAATGSGDLNKHKRIHNRERPENETDFDSAVTGTSNLISSIPKYFENFNMYH
ncbi:Protein suppressor of hairy wing [Gryllus bimaculatus]|nr:Protein suppressor of hairy wing [Gryllus bimaculatus]